ncbi:hypothetical protein PHYPSEUDO_010303 [Phytophthora pseudosyringae]|uniref:C2 domain-containing protein n=1 Tax=Phytophthora pseudosyringae TaxID=221518 RepID=A0A8T1VDP4_9STRA|nr:hypothetical protein PHYPSEUDO_010303 [Phytophthora pseudosyringae]
MAAPDEDSYTLILHVQSGQDLPTHANAAFCTTFVWSNSSPDGPAQSKAQPKYTSFSRIKAHEPVEWNEQLQLDASNPASDVLTVRVKDSSDALVGSCNIYLAHLHPGQELDQWFQLHPTGHIRLKLVLTPKQRPLPTPVADPSPYASAFQALLDLEMKKRAATVNQSPLPANIAMLLEAQRQAQQNAMLVVNQHLRQQQQATQSFMQAQSQSPFAAGFQAGSHAQAQQQSNGSNFHEMMGTAANMQQLNGNSTGGVGTSGLGTVASIGLGALGLGPYGAFFGS